MSDFTKGTNTNDATTQEEKKYITDHSYDGIREFDFPLPNWWIITFAGTAIFAAIYFVVYQFGYAPDLRQELASDLAAVKQLEGSSHGPGEDLPAVLAAAFNDSARVTAGKQVFADKCAVCHRADGGGQIGPNLTDDYWIHGKGSLTDIEQVVETGVADKGMPPWGPVLKHDELINVVVYVKSLHGSNPANPKEPQGVAVKE